MALETGNKPRKKTFPNREKGKKENKKGNLPNRKDGRKGKERKFLDGKEINA